MAFLYDFFPVLLFFAVYYLGDFFAATAVLIVATSGQVAWSWIRHRKVKTMHLVTAGLVLVFGGFTLWLQDEAFLKWKVSIVNWLFAAAFLVSGWIGERRTIVERMLGEELKLPTPVWSRLNLGWVAFFTFLGFVNWFIIENFDTEVWVNFKLFGIFGLTLVFALLQGIYLARHMPDEKSPAEKSGESD